MKKNTGALVCAIIGAIFAIIGAILWATCADALGSVSSAVGGDRGNTTIYLVLFLVLGVGGAVVSLIGGIQAKDYKRPGFVLSLVGLLMQIGNLITECVSVEGFSFLLSACTIIAVILLLVATVFSAKKGE